MSAQPNRFSSLTEELKEPVKKKQSEPKPQSDSKPKSETQHTIEVKTNRFNFTESEIQPYKKEQRFVDQGTREDYGNRERLSFRDRIQVERDRRAKDEALTAERKQIEFERSITDTALFPELIPQKPTTQSQPHNMNFLENVNWNEENPVEEKQIDLYDGFTILSRDSKKLPLKKKQRRPISPHEIMSKQVELYETWKANYIADYGEDYYEKYYRFDDYDYEYFDKLDDIYEEEMEEIERLEKEKELDQYVEYNTHYNNKNQYDD